jgi:hypothetical protein
MCAVPASISLWSFWPSCTTPGKLLGGGGYHKAYETTIQNHTFALRIIYNWNVGMKTFNAMNFDSWNWRLTRVKNMALKHTRLAKVESYCIREYHREHAPVMELVKGRYFSSMIHRYGKMNFSDVFKIVMDVTMGIAYFHEANPNGRFHFQDFAPSPLGNLHFVQNVLVNPQRVLAKLFDYDLQMIGNTRPERLREDVYHLGFMMAEAFGSNGKKIKIYNRELPRRLERVCASIPEYCRLMYQCIDRKKYPSLGSLDVLSNLSRIAMNRYDKFN